MKNVIHLNIEHDSDIENPSDHDGQWRYVSFSHPRGDRESIDDYFNEYAEVRGVYPKIGTANKLRVGTAFIVDFYEHGGVEYYLRDGGLYDGWESASVPGLLLWEHPTDEMGAKTLKDRAEDAKCFLQMYNDWANGRGYWYSVCDADGDPIDSCGGFYGSDSTHMVKECISPTIRAYMVEHGLSTYEETNARDFEEADAIENPDTLYILIDGDARDLMCYESLDLIVREAVAA